MVFDPGPYVSFCCGDGEGRAEQHSGLSIPKQKGSLQARAARQPAEAFWARVCADCFAVCDLKNHLHNILVLVWSKVLTMLAQ